MSLNLTEEQITQLAPDASSVKAGKGLASPSKWVLREYGDRAVWGHCQGSGKNPYQTVVDTRNLAFRCSCPSRKFPCKHGLGLLYLYAARQEEFRQAEEPDWVAAWLAKRDENAEKKEQKAKSAAPVDEAAQARRQAQRHEKVLRGIDDLQMWMKDLLRNGLLQVPERAGALFGGMARRMVDAQAPGLAARLRGMAEIDFFDDSWKYRLTDRLGKLWLLTEAYRHLERQSEAWQCEIRTQVGYPQAKEQVLGGEGVADRWMVLHKRSRKTDGLNSDTYWLYGERSGRFALYIDFLAPGKVSETNLVPGNFYDGELCFYNGVGRRRALFRSVELASEGFVPGGSADLDQAVARYREALQENPFTEELPTIVAGVRLVEADGRFHIEDANGKRMPIEVRDEVRFATWAVSGGRPFTAFLLADETTWELVSIWYPTDHSDYYFWRDERD